MSREDADDEEAPAGASYTKGAFFINLLLCLELSFAFMCLITRVFTRAGLHVMCFCSVMAPGVLIPLGIVSGWGLPVQGLKHRRSLAIAQGGSSSQQQLLAKQKAEVDRRVIEIEAQYEQDYQWAADFNDDLNPVTVFLGRGLLLQLLPRSCVRSNGLGACLVRIIAALISLPLWIVFSVFHLGYLAWIGACKLLQVEQASLHAHKTYRFQDAFHDLCVYTAMLMGSFGLSLARLALTYGLFSWWSTAWLQQLAFKQVLALAEVIHIVTIVAYVCALILDVSYRPAPMLAGERTIVSCTLLVSIVTILVLVGHVVVEACSSTFSRKHTGHSSGATITEDPVEAGSKQLRVRSTRGFRAKDAVIIGGAEEVLVARRHRNVLALEKELEHSHPAGTEVRRALPGQRKNFKKPRSVGQAGNNVDIERGSLVGAQPEGDHTNDAVGPTLLGAHNLDDDYFGMQMDVTSAKRRSRRPESRQH
mmetsp:Transcript_68362/g.164047  ORF Transcript_68362/g.164047 Transcript_68362/m.164047 type:complete len:477 (-) Transcript_68362:71-1501(-)